MGKVVVHLRNRPKDDVVLVDRLGEFVNMHEYILERVDKDVHVGEPLPKDKELPKVEGDAARHELIDRVRTPKDTEPQSPVIEKDGGPPADAKQEPAPVAKVQSKTPASCP